MSNDKDYKSDPQILQKDALHFCKEKYRNSVNVLHNDVQLLTLEQYRHKQLLSLCKYKLFVQIITECLNVFKTETKRKI